jgi:hypothetical protein
LVTNKACLQIRRRLQEPARRSYIWIFEGGPVELVIVVGGAGEPFVSSIDATRASITPSPVHVGQTKVVLAPTEARPNQLVPSVER